MTSVRQFNRPQPRFEIALNSRPVFEGEIRRVVQDRFDETRDALLVELIWINVAVGLFGLLLSYFLARWTLKPIEKSFAAQEQFVSDVSHELKTPLAIMRTTSEVALRNKKLSISGAKDALKQTVASVESMQHLVSTLLSLMQDTEPSRERVSVSDIVRDSVQVSIPYAQEKNISIDDTAGAYTVVTDRLLAVQVVSILLDNAIKYSRENTVVTVSSELSGQSVILSVQDVGIGIAKKDIARVFDRFYRADTARSSSDSQSYGLGLSLARKICERLGGSLSVESKLGRGSTFRFSLPVK